VNYFEARTVRVNL